MYILYPQFYHRFLRNVDYDLIVSAFNHGAVLRRYLGRNTHLPVASETLRLECQSQCVFLPSVGEVLVNGTSNVHT